MKSKKLAFDLASAQKFIDGAETREQLEKLISEVDAIHAYHMNKMRRARKILDLLEERTPVND